MKKSVKEQPKKKNGFSKLINKLMPYALAVFFAVMIFALMGFAGTAGDGLKYFFYGMLSNFGTVVFAILLLYHAIMWYYDTKRKICLRRVICSFIAVLCISTLQHLIHYVKLNELKDQPADVLYNFGKESIGGGMLGGLIGNAMLSMGSILPFVIVLSLFMLMLLQMFNITPASMIRSLGSKSVEKQEKAVKPSKKPKTKTKHKRVDIYDDDDDDAFDEDNIDDLYLTDTTVISVDEEKTYEKADKVISSARPIESSTQLRPFDESRDYTLDTGNQPFDDDNDAPFEYTSQSIDAVQEEPQEEQSEEYVPFLSEMNGVPSYTEDEDDTVYVAQSKLELADDDFEEDEPYEQAVSYEQEPVFELEQENVYSGEVSEPEQFDEPQNFYEAEIEEDVIESDFEEDFTEGDFEEIEPEAEPETEPETEPEEIAAQEKQSELPIKQEVKTEFVKPVQLEIPVPLKQATPVKEEKKPEPPKPKKRIKYVFPPIDLLDYNEDAGNEEAIKLELEENANTIVETLNNFGVRTRIVNISRGPSVTRYELAPEPGVRVKSIANLIDDIALNLAAEDLRIECPIPGKSAVGIEVPNKNLTTVYLKELIGNKKFKEAKSPLTCALGKSISGNVEYVDIEKTPHLLVAGATSMGKSVCINSMLISLLYKSNPNDVRLILVDPKKVEFSDFNGLPHLLVPVVIEPKKVLGALQWSVTEMERRFEIFQALGKRNLIDYNESIDNGMEGEKIPRIVIVIDELADLKMTVPEIEGYITRLTQKARAAGIHVIIGTQRPSVDVITGLIKSNIPSRISFRVSSQIDSRTILDEVGAEKLVHRGDMLAKIIGMLRPIRIQGSLVTPPEVQAVIEFIKEHSSENYDEGVMQQIDSNAAKLAKADKKDEGGDDSGGSGEDYDDKFYAAIKLGIEQGKISSSMLMRKLGLGFQRASRIIDQMEECGYISEANGSKPRDVLISKEAYMEMMMRREDTEE